MADIVAYNWNGTPIYAATSADVEIIGTKQKKKSNIDLNNIISQVPGTISALSSLFGKPQAAPIINQYGQDPNAQKDNTLLYVGGAIALIIIVLLVKK